ncbi:MAG: helix-turn-helix domain-containing protein [Pseudooceanicola nanhaiensis]|uniref:helix-turn-helix domain-containing protein n=1 Tax=Pseudooceanicola nanhaiensis TaxID=375761 RepID=UPI004058038E
MRRRYQPDIDTREAQPRGFDDFELKLGDVMRGERATMGKSLLDVQRELRIKASYISAIENCDPDAFDTPGFIAGYVRSYARYLNMNPDEVFAAFCAESGFSTPHGVSAQASSRRKDDPIIGRTLPAEKDPFMRPGTPFVPERDGFLARIEPSAIGSAFVLLALIAGLGYGAWSVLNEVQRVQVAPSENTPDVLTDLDPLDGATRPKPEDVAIAEASGVFSPPAEALDRLYRPQALDVPVMVARDAPISTLDPARIGTYASDLRPGGETSDSLVDDALRRAVAETETGTEEVTPFTPRVVEAAAPGVSVFAVRPAWIRIRAANGSIIFEKILDAGESYDLPQTEDAPVLRAGMAGSLYFRVNGELYGPAGQGTSTIRDVALSVTDLTGKYQVADLTADPEAARVVAEAQVAEPTPAVQVQQD